MSTTPVTITFQAVDRSYANVGQSISISGKALPSSVSIQDNTTSISYNTALGEFIDLPIALKRKLELKWDILSGSQVNALYYTGLLTLIKSARSRYFRITTSGSNDIVNKLQAIGSSNIFYLGTPVTFNRIGENGTTTYYSGELHFIQVIGDVINDPVGT